MRSTLYVVHCVDTEGPLFESIEATFERLKNIFGIKINPSEDNLKSLRNEEINLDVSEKKVSKLVDKRLIETNENWGEIESQFRKVTSKSFRKKYSDSDGRGWRYSWFIMDHSGFNGVNPRRRSLGNHVIFDQYKRWLEKKEDNIDEINFHYHPISIRSDAHRCATEYVGSKNIFEILARKIIDRQWFPAAYRPGFHAERPDSHWLLEQWIPFDFGNQSGKTSDDQPDLARGRFGNWRRAPTSWIPYNPSHDDYQSRGDCRRYIARCLNMDTRHGNLTREDVIQAFEEAVQQGQSLLSFTDHDHRKMDRHVDKVWSMIDEVSNEFQDVNFRHATAIEGIRAVLGMDAPYPPKLNAEIEEIEGKTVLSVGSQNDIFGPQPFLALKTKSGNYIWQNFDRPDTSIWTYTFDFHTLPIDSIDRIGVAANSPNGVTDVLRINPDQKKVERRSLNIDRD
ncbi:hypothetical protein GGQ00_003074 [Salinibacter ruber]|uniref:hypothetical protein n=1 Tax=Salinibacter ruber TaxID=146919 RepID=UPI0021699409|nr:hypothetical protein [Salinibacter ruber]MCS4044614.1 hypothetical protein [Salinibacter ruber]